MNLSKFLPFENYVIATNLSAEEIKKRLAENIEPKKGFEFFKFADRYSKPYIGDLHGDTFTISRVINYRNSFLPAIKGEISTYFGETRIRIKMRPATGVIIFMCVWLGFVGLMCLFLIFGLLFLDKDNGPIDPAMFIPFGMLLFGYLLVTLGFKFESSNSKKFLAELLEKKDDVYKLPGN